MIKLVNIILLQPGLVIFEGKHVKNAENVPMQCPSHPTIFNTFCASDGFRFSLKVLQFKIARMI